jgi:tetraacyldisaccharide 4'-kinase
LRTRLPALWYRRAPPPPLALRALSWAFAAALRVRRRAYARGWLRSRRLAAPVVVIGNLNVGGSGKTPLAIWLVAQLRAAGYQPGVVLRGYGGAAARGRGALRVEPDSDPVQVGDEALLLRRRTQVPVAVCRDRVRAAQLLLAQGVDVIVADDGLQHLALARNFEIAVIDGERGFGNGYLLPAGPLREPPRRLASVDAVVVNGEGRYWGELAAAAAAAAAAGAGRATELSAVAAGPGRPFTMRLRGERLAALGGGNEAIGLSSLAGQRVHALAGIGNPERFFAQLRAAGLELIEHAFPDHHRYRADELAFDDALPLLMTEKDAVKCSAFGGPNRWYLPVTAEFAAAEAAALLGRLRRALEIPNRALAGD